MMNAVQLNDGRSIPQLGYGTWKLPNDDAQDLVAAAIETGFRHIDTAAIYGNEVGVGAGIASSGIARDEIFVTTKLWNNAHREPAARQAIEESLEKLGLDHVDLYLVHWPTLSGNYIEAWESLIAFRDEGLATSIGVSNFTPKHLDRITMATDVYPAVNQIELHPSFTQVPTRATNTHLGIATQAWTPLGSSDLQLETITKIAQDLDVTPAQVILAWHLEIGNIVIPKTATKSRLAENFACDIDLSDDQVAAISSLDRGNRLGGNPDDFDMM